MKHITFFLLMVLLLPLLSSAQTGKVKWRVTFTYNETKSSSRLSPVIESSYSFSMNGSVSMLISGDPSFDNGHVIIKTPQDSVLSFSVTGSVSERIEDKTKDPLIGILETRLDQYEGKADQSEQGVEFEYDPSTDGAKYINAGIRFNKKGSYEINRYHQGAGESNHYLSYVDIQDFGAYTASIGSSNDVIKAVKNGFIIDGQITENNNTPGAAGETYTSSKKVEYHITIMKEIDYDVLIVPANDEQYKKWLPVGPSLTGEGDRGNTINLKIILVNKKNPLKPVESPFTAEWNLKSSAEPGYCMNFPDEKKADKKKDLRFDQSANAIKDFQSISENKAVSKKGKGDAPVTIISYDYGGYASITASVTLDDGTVAQAVSKFDNKPVFKVPMDDNDNHIADEWEKQEAVFEKNYAADWDEDYLPQGLGDHNGDGLTLYEEYRGFSENKKHIRTSAKTKDLMVCDMIGDRSKDGISIFKGVTKINVHDDFQLDEFGREAKDVEAEGMPKDKCINFNYSRESHSVDQHGIALVKSLEKKGYAQAVTKIADGPIGTPKNYKYLEITLDFDPGPSGFNIVSGIITNASTVTADPAAKAKIITDDYAVTVAHEMLHCCNVKHHGDKDLSDALLIAGKDIPAGTKNPKNIVIEANKLYIIFNAILYTPSNDGNGYWEDGAVITADEIPSPRGLKLYIGLQNGQHSGFEDCIMRYDAANSYIGKDTKFYLIDRKPGYNREMAGTSLCTAATGTGVNDKKHLPQPRYGNADTDRGNCKHQFCINDKYH